MPFKSRAQERWMWGTHPEMAKKWEGDTDAAYRATLPEKVKLKKPKARKPRIPKP